MFDRDYNFRGKHANIVTQLTAEIDSDSKFKLFERNIDVLILAPIVGFLYGRMADRDESGQVTVDNIKKINFDQINRESYTLNYNYELIMLLHDKDKLVIEERLDRAFRYAKGSNEKAECYKIFEKYVLGGIEVLKEKLLDNDNPTSVDDYINNIYYFLQDYNDRYNNAISENEILDLCINPSNEWKVWKIWIKISYLKLN